MPCNSSKRTPSSGHVTSTTLPELPKINGEILLDIFMHRSLRTEASSGSVYTANERLSVLGMQVLEMVVTELLFHEKPILNAKEILVCDPLNHGRPK
jgi:dsRNA-specific ribonuclease